MRPRQGIAGIVLCLAWSGWGCSEADVIVRGEYGRPVPMLTGDGSDLPRLVFIDEGCPAPDIARGGCPTSDDPRACRQLLLDTLAPISAVRNEGDGLGLSTECMQIRGAHGMGAASPPEDDRRNAVARFEFDEFPLIRAPWAGTSTWTWTAGDERGAIEPGGVLGGNLLRAFAWRVRRDDPLPSITLYSAYPGSEGDLANQGRSFLPLQFPGRLLGRSVEDQCRIGSDRCEIDGIDIIPDQEDLALRSSRMVMDACVAVPPCMLQYIPNSDPLAAGTCTLATGPEGSRCVAPDAEGRSASLVIATGVSGLVLFADSAQRMFGDIATLPACASVLDSTQACHEGQNGVLHLSGWPSAGLDVPLHQIRVRSVALLPGLVESKGPSACTLVSGRLEALSRQCARYIRSVPSTGTIADAAPPYSARADDEDGNSHELDPAKQSLTVLGEAWLTGDPPQTRPNTWIRTLVVPEHHPMAIAVRRDVVPEALQPDGLLGTVLFEETEVVLDYTDPNPGIRVKCLSPDSGRCFTMPDCAVDRTPACCFGMPQSLLSEFIVGGEDDVCCGALSAEALRDIQVDQERCQGVDPP